jgi:hypothetical protein
MSRLGEEFQLKSACTPTVERWLVENTRLLVVGEAGRSTPMNPRQLEQDTALYHSPSFMPTSDSELILRATEPPYNARTPTER